MAIIKSTAKRIWKPIRLRFGKGSGSHFVRVRDKKAEEAQKK